MKSLMLLWQEVLIEMGTWCHTSTSRDLRTASARFEHEGVSFLTITLPDFGKDLQKALSLEKVDHDLFKGFAFTGGLPRFLGGFLDLVFDRGTGRMRDSPSIDAIYALRQITLMCAKISLPCSEERTRRAIDGYITCEKEVKRSDSERNVDDYHDFTRLRNLLFGDLLSRVDYKVYKGEIIPKHGPGATADKLRGNAKYRQTEWPARLEYIYPGGEFLIPNWRYNELLDRLTYLEPGAERPVKVITVPKTLKTPRIIAVEPTAMQYVQQAIAEVFVEEIEGDHILSSFLGFTDQVPNQHMARTGSLSGNLATLDLSEASDRVSNQLVRAFLDRHPHIAEATDASRSRKADVPGHGIIRLAKFASMGSAMCFPMEAMVFLTVCFVGIERSLSRPLTRKDIKSFMGQVRVYGDDIIVPVDHVESVVQALKTFGFKVNLDKSFWTGKFRESCGKEYFDGHDVSIVKIREMLPTRLTDATEIISTVATRNLLYWKGLWRTCQWIDNWVAPVLRGRYPRVEMTSSVIGRESVFGYETVSGGYDPDLQIPLVRGYVESSNAPVNPLDDVGALLKFFLKRGELPFFDTEHLRRSGRPQRVDIKLRWVSPI